MEYHLRACPHCGGRAKLEYHPNVRWRVRCVRDAASENPHGHCLSHFNSPKEAADAWNYRPEDYSLGNITDWAFVNMNNQAEPEYTFYASVFDAIMKYRFSKKHMNGGEHAQEDYKRDAYESRQQSQA